jgi:hypothetical protein
MAPVTTAVLDQAVSSQVVLLLGLFRIVLVLVHVLVLVLGFL